MLTEKEKLILILDLDLDMSVADFDHFKLTTDKLKENINSLTEEEINVLNNLVLNHDITIENFELRNYLIENLNIFNNKDYLKFVGELHLLLNEKEKNPEEIKKWLDNNIIKIKNYENEQNFLSNVKLLILLCNFITDKTDYLTFIRSIL